MHNLKAILEANKAKKDANQAAAPEKNAPDDNQSGKKDKVPPGGKTLTDQKANKIDVAPDVGRLNEETGKHAVVSFGRMNPPTVGHEKLVDHVKKLAKEKGAEAHVFLSHSHDSKKNPLSYEEKHKLAHEAFGSVVKHIPKDHAHMLGVAKHLDGKVDHLHMVVGSDRVDEVKKKLNAYNGKDYNYKSIHVHSAGTRDPDAEGTEGMSASKMRAHAAAGNHDEFKKGLPKALHHKSHEIMHAVSGKKTIGENIVEALTAQQRQKRKIQFSRIKNRIQLGRQRAMRRRAPKDALVKRSRRLAIKNMRNRILRGQKYEDLPYASRAIVDQRLKKRMKSINRLAQRLLPKVARAESQRKLGTRFVGIEKPGAHHVVSEEVLHQMVQSVTEDMDYQFTDREQASLIEKAKIEGYPVDILESVFRRGLNEWTLVESNLSFQEYAYNRVNSFIAGGAAWDMDFDLLEDREDWLMEAESRATPDGDKNTAADGVVDNEKDDLVQTVIARMNSNPVPNRTTARPGKMSKQVIMKKIISEAGMDGTKRRIDMPQLTDFDGFSKDLSDNGHKMTAETRKPSDLEPSQKHFNQEKVDRLIASGSHKDKPIIVSSDDKIVDGHHRWEACNQDGCDVKTKKVSLKADELLDFVKGKPYTEKKGLHEDSGSQNG